MNGQNRVPFRPHLDASPDDPVQLLAHFPVAPLHRPQIPPQVFLVLHPRRRRPSAHPDAVSRPADLAHKNPLVILFSSQPNLLAHPGVYGAEAGAEHYRFRPLKPLVAHGDAAGAEEARHQRLPELVAVATGPVARLHRDHLRVGQRSRLG